MEHSLASQLKSQIETLPPQLARAAKYIVDHPAEFGMQPIRDTAQDIGVSANTLVRLANRLGFDTFEALRAPFREALKTEREGQLGADWLDQMATKGPFEAQHARLLRGELNVVSRSLRLMAPDKAEQAISAIQQAQTCYVTATRASYALAYYFHYVGRMMVPGMQLVPRHMGSALDELIDIGPQDCLVAMSFAPYSSETIQSMRFAQSRGARLILISDSEVIAPQVAPDVVFVISSLSPHFFGSYGGGMAVVECLLGHLAAQAGPEAAQRIADYQSMREETGAYWQPAKPPRIKR
jgi:DNA-binding MurR/RpiR family transcriptional regulator